jgi:hypothetical protein
VQKLASKETEEGGVSNVQPQRIASKVLDAFGESKLERLITRWDDSTRVGVEEFLIEYPG